MGGPSFIRIDQTEPYDEGRDVLREILMVAMREDASRVTIRPHEGDPSRIHLVMKFVRDTPTSRFASGLDELIAHLAAPPNNKLRLNLDDLVDEYASEFRPCSAWAHDRIAWFRSAHRKEYEALIQVDDQAREAEITLRLIK